MSISELAKFSGIKSESAIVRLYKKLKFNNFHEFRLNLAIEIAGKSFYHTSADNVENVTKKIFKGAIKTLQENLHHVDYDSIEKAVKILSKAKRLILLGFATSGAIMQDVYIKFLRLGFECYYSLDPHINAIITSEPKKGDVVFAISHYGDTRDVVIPATNAKKTAKVIAITGYKNSPLSSIADVSINTISEELSIGTDAMISRIVQLILIDVLFINVALSRNPKIFRSLTKKRQSVSYLKY